MLRQLRLRIYSLFLGIRDGVGHKDSGPSFVNPYKDDLPANLQRNDVAFNARTAINPLSRESYRPSYFAGGPAKVTRGRHWILQNCDEVMREDWNVFVGCGIFMVLAHFTGFGPATRLLKKAPSAAAKEREYEDFLENYCSVRVTGRVVHRLNAEDDELDHKAEHDQQENPVDHWPDKLYRKIVLSYRRGRGDVKK